MSFNLPAALKITAEVTGLPQIQKLEKGLLKTEEAAKSAAKGFSGMLKTKAFQGLAVAATGIATAFGLSAKAAIDFEEKMADVLKVMEDMSQKEVKALRKEIIGLGQELPIAISGIAEIYEAAGQSGEAREDMREFALDVGRIKVAFDVTAEEAGKAMANMKAALGIPQDKLRDLFDAINHLGDNTAAASSDIMEFMSRAAGAGKAAGLAAEQTAALGAAMIGSGTESRVAATSLRSLVSALTRGASMTDKQVSALSRLGYAQGNAKAMERRLTSEVERQSDERIEIARNETDQISKEINRRYRDQMTALRDSVDDESEEFEEGVTDKADKQVKGLQRQMDREMEMARQRAERTGKSATAETQRIRDKYDDQIDAVRDNMRDELKVRRRADRDRLTKLQDRLDDEKEVELKANEKKFKEFEKQEKDFRSEQLEQAKATAREIGSSMGKQMAQSMQDNAMGTITDVFSRIRSLSKAEQLSIFTDLAGEQSARGFVNLINNAQKFEEVMSLVGDKSNYAGSAMREFAKRNNTTAAEIQKMRNALEGAALDIGQSLVPVIKQLTGQVIIPLINGFSWLLKNVPGFVPAVLLLGGAIVGLAVGLPILSSIVFLMSSFGVALSGGGIVKALALIATKFKLLWATISGFKVGAIFAGFGAKMIAGIVVSLKFIGAAFASVFGSVPVLIGLAIAGSIALIWRFRDQIGDFLKWIGQGFLDVGKNIADFLTEPMKRAINFVKTVWSGLMNWLHSLMKKAFGWITNIINAAKRAFSFASGGKGKAQTAKPMAKGGYVSGPTLALVGEGGDSEYVVPSKKVRQFSKNILAGISGPAAIPAFAQGGFVSSSGSTGGTPNIHIQTGPVLQQQGVEYVTVADLEGALQTFSKSVFGNSRTTGGRRFQGVH